MAPPPLLYFRALLALLVPSAAQPPAANASSSAAPTVQVTVGVLVPERNLSYPWSWPRVAPALSLALEALQPQLRLDGISVRTKFASTETMHGTCSSLLALFKAAELKVSREADVLFGMGCLEDYYLSYFQSWQLPLLLTRIYQWSSDCSMVVNAGPLSRHDFFAFQARLLRHFNWTARAVTLLGRNYRQAYPPLRHASHGAVSPDFISPEDLYTGPGEAVSFIQAKGRVVFLYGSLKMVQEIMHLAQAQKMTNGDYVFFYLDLFGESLRAEGHREAAKPWQSKESHDTGVLREAFQTVLVMTPHEPQTPEYQRFQSQLILRAQRDFGVAINDSLGHLVSGCFHDGLLLYLRALNETLREGGTKRNTSHIMEKMRSLKIQGVTGMVSINTENEQETDFDLWAMRDVESGEYQVVGHYIASEKQINWTGPILWKTGRPPLDNPPCVFDMSDPSCGKNGCV